MTLPKEEEVTMALLRELPKLAEKHGTDKAMQILENVGKIVTFVSQFSAEDFCLALNFLIGTMPPEMVKEMKEALQ